jgi:hypothetical protein
VCKSNFVGKVSEWSVQGADCINALFGQLLKEGLEKAAQDYGCCASPCFVSCSDGWGRQDRGDVVIVVIGNIPYAPEGRFELGQYSAQN